MANVISLNFDDAPPASGGSGFGDHIPQGGYQLKMGKVSQTTTKTGKLMVIAEYMTSNKKRLTENFVIPRDNSDDSKFPLQRFHALLVGLGAEEFTGKGMQNLDLDALYGREFVADVRDEVVAANGDYPERIISRPTSYYRVGSEEGNRMLTELAPQALGEAATVAVAQAAAATVPAAAPAEAFPAAEPATAVAPPAPAPVEAAPPAAEPAPAAPPAAAPTSVDDELDSMFSSPA